MALSVGQEAPDFELPLAGNQGKFKPSEFRGKQPVVLLFFPLAWTGVCTKEMCEVRDNYSRYTGINAKVVGISVDSPFAIGKFKEDENLPFDMASDFNKDAMTKYGAKYDEFIGLLGVAKRSAFVIGKDGKIVYAQVNDDPKQLPDFEKILAAVKSAQ
jgi:glutaredoxin-dependent peroxiredoxin